MATAMATAIRSGRHALLQQHTLLQRKALPSLLRQAAPKLQAAVATAALLGVAATAIGSSSRCDDALSSSSAITGCANITASLAPTHLVDASVPLRYKLGEVLGVGNSGSVCEATDRWSGEAVAIKTVPRSSTTDEAILHETSILQASAHENVVGLRALGGDAPSWYIVMERARGEELYERLVNRGMLSQRDAATVLRQLLGALVHLHARGIIHSDIKPENIIIAEQPPPSPPTSSPLNSTTTLTPCSAPCTTATPHTATGTASLSIKLADFGSAFCTRSGASGSSSDGAPPIAPFRRPYGGARSSAHGGSDYTAAYAPPEVLSGAAPRPTPAADVFAVGVVAYVLLTGRHPFDPSGGAGEREVRAAVLRGRPDFNDEVWGGVDPRARELVRAALSTRPGARPTAADMLADPWVQQQAAAAAVPAAAVAAAAGCGGVGQ